MVISKNSGLPIAENEWRPISTGEGYTQARYGFTCTVVRQGGKVIGQVKVPGRKAFRQVFASERMAGRWCRQVADHQFDMAVRAGALPTA